MDKKRALYHENAPVRSSGNTGPRERDLRFASTGERGKARKREEFFGHACPPLEGITRIEKLNESHEVIEDKDRHE